MISFQKFMFNYIFSLTHWHVYVCMYLMFFKNEENKIIVVLRHNIWKYFTYVSTYLCCFRQILNEKFQTVIDKSERAYYSKNRILPALAHVLCIQNFMHLAIAHGKHFSSLLWLIMPTNPEALSQSMNFQFFESRFACLMMRRHYTRIIHETKVDNSHGGL